MKSSKFTEAQIAFILKQGKRGLGTPGIKQCFVSRALTMSKA